VSNSLTPLLDYSSACGDCRSSTDSSYRAYMQSKVTLQYASIATACTRGADEPDRDVTESPTSKSVAAARTHPLSSTRGVNSSTRTNSCSPVAATSTDRVKAPLSVCARCTLTANSVNSTVQRHRRLADVCPRSNVLLDDVEHDRPATTLLTSRLDGVKSV
jgi:hypothetical protein